MSLYGLSIIFSNDVRKCIEKEILPYRKELGYWTYKNIKYPYIRNYKFKGYSLLEKLLFIFINIDLISINQIKKIKLKTLKNKEKNTIDFLKKSKN